MLTLELQRLQTKGETATSTNALGGSLLLVDLVGADYDHCGGDAQKESTAINQSLLALKECFQLMAATASTSMQQQKSQSCPWFQRSKLTCILEDSLLPWETSR